MHASSPDDFIYTLTGRVVAGDPSDEVITVGKFRAYYVDANAAFNYNKVSLYDIFDTYQETVDYYEAIYDINSEEFSEKLLKALKADYLIGNVLIIDRLEILPAFRSYNLGLITMRRLILRFGIGAGITAIKPFPLQFEMEIHRDDDWKEQLVLTAFDKNSRSATASLKKHYRKLGFVPLPGTPFMFLENDKTLPSVADLRR
ncbi:Hypothetical protein HEAR3040 [Herminiimonas arsenicoxydans]|uniref:Uncharacterized protein n=1 Tax=Herminiimonas arsenicoxydans TaxID=204773 RepID=A4G9G2_HERAR|nr:Hypothetical protein HEAR3040 [Herminiimonas arsenicoxydans]